MRKSLNWSAVSQWQQLMAEWDDVTAEYELASRRSQETGLPEGERAAFQSAAAGARTRLQELKLSIDELIASSGAERDVSGDQFTVATIEIGRNADDPHPGPAQRARSVKR